VTSPTSSSPPLSLPPDLSLPLLISILEREQANRLKANALKAYRPYKKQAEFHAADFRERALLAGNQLGKTLAAGMEVAMHLTGRYPPWWVGKRFTRPVRWLAGSESAELTRKGVQRILLGPPEIESEWGTGAIPRECLLPGISRRPGVPDAVASIPVRHESGGTSVIQLASYDQGRTKWQADTVDGVWLDEEPPLDIYSEAMTRTNTTLGPVLLTLTPLLGMSDVVKRYLIEKPEGSHVTTMTIEDAEHYTPEARVKIIAAYPAHEREARAKGIPMLGSGRIFPVTEESIAYDAFDMPKHWPRIGGMDFGWDHPFAACELCWDRDSDVVYLTKAYRKRESTPILHAAALKPWGDWLPWAWPRDGHRETLEGAGIALAEQFKAQGLAMLLEHSQFENKSVSVEAGLMDWLDRMQTGRFKAAKHLNDFWEEFRLYHRKDGKVVKENDDLMSAIRYALMMLRYADTAPKVKAEQDSGGSSSWA
jgi:phage terminase large subunit-like protein